MDSTEYNEKIKLMLSDVRVYKKLEKNPSPGYKRWLVSVLPQLMKEDKITQDQYYHLYPTSDMEPRLYGSSRIQKDGAPLCPIVDYIDSMAYNTSSNHSLVRPSTM